MIQIFKSSDLTGDGVDLAKKLSDLRLRPVEKPAVGNPSVAGKKKFIKISNTMTTAHQVPNRRIKLLILTKQL